MKHSQLAAPRLLVLLWVSLFAAPSAWAGTQPRQVKSATSVVRVWSASQHLYVKGDVGASDEQLRELEEWLTEQAPHWTVVLLESAEGESFTDAEGTGFEGMDAVLHALGKGLSNRTRFGSLKHPRTGEQDGAIFVLSMADRNLSYFGSRAQDRRGLGEDRWKGQLDAPAIAAMRDGGRILDAARDTVVSIDARLATAIEREVAEAERLRASLGEQLRALPAEVDALLAQQQALFGGAPPAGVARANPDFAGLRTRIASALVLLKPGKPAPLDTLQSAHDALRASLDEAREGLDECRRAHERVKSLEGLLADFERLGGLQAFVEPELKEARAMLEQARAAVLTLERSYTEQLDAVNVKLRGALAVIEEVKQAATRMGAMAGSLEALEKAPYAEAAQAHLFSAREALRRANEAFARHERAFIEHLRASEAASQSAAVSLHEAERAAWWRRVAALVAGGVLFLLLARARVRRNARRREAVDLLARWRKAIDEKTQALLELLERTHLVTGHSREEVEARYTGVTRERALKLASDVDELFLLAAASARVLGEVEEWVASKGALDALGAHLSTGRYERATRRLRDEPIVFHPDEGVELVLRGTPTTGQRLIGILSSYQPFSLSFEALVEAFNTRAASALAALEPLETAQPRASEAVSSLERLVGELRAGESSGPGPLRVPSLVEQVVPSLEALLERARPLLPRDVVAALEGPLAEGQRQAADTRALLEVLAGARSEVRPLAERAGVALVGAGLPRGWVEEALDAFTRRVDAVARELSAQPSAEAVKALVEDRELLRTRCLTADSLVGVAGRARSELTRLVSVIQLAREELGGALRKAPSAMLREEGLDPSERIASGEQSLTGGREALGRGALEAAREALDAALARVAEAEALVADSREAHKRFESRRDACREETRRLAALTAERETLLGGVKPLYQSSALLLRAGDPEHPNPNGTVQDNLSEVASHAKEAAALLHEAGGAFSDARLLASADLLRRVEGHQALIQHRLDELSEKVHQLRALEARNAEVLATTEALATACAAAVEDVRTMKPTVQAQTLARKQLQQAREAVKAKPAEPFEAAEALARAAGALGGVKANAEADHQRHAQAVESFASAREELSSAEALARRAAGDGITDSSETTRAMRSVEELARALRSASGGLDTAHGDWNALETEADRLFAAVARASSTLRGELAAAERAVSAIQGAASAVHRADQWRGLYGVTISGRPGASLLSAAQGSLRQGIYPAAQSAADSAERQARDAILHAEREVDARRREEEERQEAERRRREAEAHRRREDEADRQRATSSSHGSWGSSSSSSGSGFSSSSWGSRSSGGGGSGSGFGSSSW